jgi:hypothetical protein
MPRSSFTRDGITVSLDDGWDAAVRQLLSAAQTETIRVLERAGDEEAAKAEAAWYSAAGVTRRTGRSGYIERVTTFDASKGEVRVSVGSADTRLDPQKRKPTPLFVRRPGRLSVVRRVVTQGEWWAWKKAGKPVAPRIRGAAPWQIEVPNPKASDGKFLIVELVRKPVQARIPRLAPELAQAISVKAAKGG